LSDRITNLMAADSFFNQRRGVRAVNRLEKERFTLKRDKARRIIWRENNPTQPTTKGIDFEQWQIDLAVKVLEGETNG